ncbi:RrF2 family transcriptional regulator [Gynurincola endophyticus]|uniref:RrF2 family transcriptional regulator n=1 Tax=Gynurincola endophyticus TaxID=2479004 RepID=UPI000F8E6C02|nr:Rrf2 family transcriptional regulator [Gynurincola endophyticus]
MGIFSKTCEYAMRAVFYIASQSKEGQRKGLKEIAENINSPEHFLAKILQKLSKEGIVQSVKGPNGGFYIAHKSLQLPLVSVITVLEGETAFTGCGLGLSNCSEKNPCPLHLEFKKVRRQLNRMFRETTIGDFNEELLKGNFTLNR